MSVEPLISIIVVSFNTCNMTLACLRSIVREMQSVSYEVIVIDNASDDGSVEEIEAALPYLKNTQLIKYVHNIGFAAANNLAIKVARGRHLLLLNPDTLVQNQAVDKLYQFALDNPASRIWGGRTVFPDGSLNPTNCYREMSLQQIFFRSVGLASLFSSSDYFNGEVYGRWERDSEREVEVVTGCFLMIEREFWNELGGFDPVFFMFGEETDLCMRARKLGARPRFTPEAQIVHYGGASQSIRAERMIKVMASKVTLVRRHMQGFKRNLAIFFLLFWPLSRVIAFRVAALAKRNSGSKCEAWLGVWKRRDEWINGFKDTLLAKGRGEVLGSGPLHDEFET